jgi:hypothetical protein
VIVENLELLTKVIIMTKNRFLAGIMSLFIGLLTVSCTQENAFSNFKFEVYTEDGSAIEGTQTVEFSKTKTVTFAAAEVKSLDIVTPEGWSSQVKFSARKINISAPKAENLDAAVSGAVTMTATSLNGETKVVTFNVAAQESSLSFAVAGVAEGAEFRYAESKTFSL